MHDLTRHRILFSLEEIELGDNPNFLAFIRDLHMDSMLHCRPGARSTACTVRLKKAVRNSEVRRPNEQKIQYI